MPVVVPVRRPVNDRAVSCLDDSCPICFGVYFQDDSNSGFYPVFQRCCLKAICYRCLIRYIKSQNDHLVCPMCRADIETDIIRRPPIIPIPESPSNRLMGLIGPFRHRPRLTEALIRSIG